jgi:hypothetical protein
VAHGAPTGASRVDRLKCGGLLKRREWKDHLKGANMYKRLRKRKRGDMRISMEPRTTKGTIVGWRAIARRICWDDGVFLWHFKAALGKGRDENSTYTDLKAKNQTRTNPDPFRKGFTGPKCPQASASRQFDTSGVNLYRMRRDGIRRRASITSTSNTSRQGLMPSSDMSN